MRPLDQMSQNIWLNNLHVGGMYIVGCCERAWDRLSKHTESLSQAKRAFNTQS